MFARSLARSLTAASATGVRPASTVALSPAVQALNLSGLDGRYSMALYKAAKEKDALAKVETDLKALKKLTETDRGVRDFFQTPVLNVAQKKSGIVSIAKKIGFSPVTTNFLNVLAENSRMNQLHKVTESFATILAAHRGEVQATITTAKEIDSKIRTQLEAAIKKNFVKAGESLSVTTKIDPTILGGTVVQVGDKTIDLSVSTKLNRLNQLLAEAI